MGLIARLNNFVNDRIGGLAVSSSKVNAELNQIDNVLNGTDTTTRLYTQFNGTLPVMRLDQLGGGLNFDTQKSGAARVAINGNGQVQSSLATGTAPFSLVSSTLCPGLNANLISGVDPLVSWVSQVLSGQQVKGNLQVNPSATGDGLKLLQDSDLLTCERTSDGADIFTLETQHSATRALKFTSSTDVQVAYTPVASNDVARYQEMLPSRFAMLFNSFTYTIALNQILAGCVVPGNWGWKLQELKAVWQAVAPSVNTTFTLRKWTGGVSSDLATVTIAPSTPKGNIISTALASVAVAKGDILTIVCTAGNGSGSNYTCQVNGLR